MADDRVKADRGESHLDFNKPYLDPLLVTAVKILDLADDAIISVDDEQRIILFNQGAERIFGYSSTEVTGQALEILLPQEEVADLRDTAEAQRREICARRKDNSEFPAEASISKVDMQGHSMFTMILRDVSHRREAEEKINASLREKEALLKEIHHRVKNNLQVISSLLGLQARAIADEETRKIFQESQDRVHSMALLHESLYQSSNLSRVDFPDYIRQLASHLFHSYGVGDQRIRLRTELTELFLNLDAALPCGLIINELVSNSLKYAFPEGSEGEVLIALTEHADGMARLVVADNGVGLRSDVDLLTARTLGLRLVRTLAEQLGAKLEVDSKSGTEVRLTFAAAS